MSLRIIACVLLFFLTVLVLMAGSLLPVPGHYTLCVAAAAAGGSAVLAVDDYLLRRY